MKKVILYIAMSLDGYIADSSGGVSWLTGQDETAAEAGSYPTFIQGVDRVVMGWSTYHQVVTELSPNEWVYDGLTSYVITHRELPSTEKIRFAGDPCDLIRRLRQEGGKNIWICGGASLAGQLMAEDLIDVYHISVIPTILGEGIRLFGRTASPLKLRLTGTQTYNGITDLIYERR